MSKPATLSKPPPAAATAPFTAKPAPHASPRRHDLAEALMDLRDAEGKAEAAREPIARLEAEIADEAAARALLAEVDGDYATQMAEWSGGAGGNAPEPNLDTRQEAEAAMTAATLKADAARAALTRQRQAIGEADARAGDARARIKPAIAAVLREEGTWLAAEYWRRWADLEQVRRELTALDQLLIADFPTIHAPTGRMMIAWLSPDRQPAPAQLTAAETASADLATMPEIIRDWRAKADALAR